MPPRYDDELIARWRLRNQFLVEPFAPNAHDAIQRLLCVQAENVGQTAWAIECRVDSTSNLDDLLADGRIVRTHVLRPTWHYAAAEDIGWLLALTGPRVQKVTATQLRRVHGLDDITAAMDTVVAAVGDLGEPTRAELAAELDARGLRDVGDRPGMFVMILLAHTELAALICSGAPRDGEHTYAVFTDRIAPQPALDRATALAELTRRYFSRHGPATERDLAYWATLPLGDVRAGLAAVGSELDCFEHDGRTFWHASGDVPPRQRPRPRAHLLQILDEHLRGYQDSRNVIDAAGLVEPGRSTAAGLALIDGQQVATFKRTTSPTTVTFRGSTLRPLTSGETQALARTADEYARFLGLEPRLQLE